LEAIDLVSGASVLITAGAGGFGRRIAEMFADANARAHVCDLDQGAVDALVTARPDIRSFMCDAGDADAIDELIAEIGAVDVLINNVGISGPTANAEDISVDEWERTLRTNLTSHFLAARRVIPGMKARGRGLIINISSGSAKIGLPLRLPYVVSKGAILSLTMNLARELGPSGIRVNAILPGAVRGERYERVKEAKAEALGLSVSDYEATLLRYVSLRTMIEPDDLAAMALFLASSAGARITGQMIGVDGNVEWWG
jgi:NAD(P)-dependent dehydrogenase (short-subunit alcohol dehydrogenase family)